MASISSKQRFTSFLESQQLTVDNDPLALSFSGRSIDDLLRLRGVPFAAITFYGAGAGGSEDFAIYHNCFWTLRRFFLVHGWSFFWSFFWSFTVKEFKPTYFCTTKLY